MRYRGGGLGSAPSPVWREDEWRQTHTENTRKHTHVRPHPHITRTRLSQSRVTGPAALFVTTLDERAPEEQVVHNVIPLKDKMPRPGFSDVHGKAKREAWQWHLSGVSQTLHILMSDSLLKTLLPLTHQKPICERAGAGKTEAPYSSVLSVAVGHSRHVKTQACTLAVYLCSFCIFNAF